MSAAVELERPVAGRISLPWKCLVADNARHEVLRTKGGGRRIGLTERYRLALAAASALAAQQWARQDLAKLRGPVCIRVTLHEPDKRRRDVANYCKLTMDALTQVCFVDDSQIDQITVTRGALDRVAPRADIDVEAVP